MENSFISRIARVLRSALSPDVQLDRAFRIPIESLESRLLLSVNYTSYDNVNVTTGVNSQETALTPSNVNIHSFGKQYSVPVDGEVYAEPLVETGVTITSGPNTTAGAAGMHNVVFVATENDMMYAIDTTSGAILWQRTFLNQSAGAAGTDINNPLGATSITTVPYTDTHSGISPEIGITGTPVIDSANNRLFVVVSTKETIGGVINWVQRLHAISLSNGTDVVIPYLIAATPASGADDTNIYVYGTGYDAVTDPYNGTGKQVVQFNALRQNQRGGLSLVDGILYVDWASHGDTDPYHGWLVAWNVNNLTTTGFTLKGVFNDTPNDGEGGIWEGAGEPVFVNGGAEIYLSSGTGLSAPTSFDSNGFPTDGDYADSLIELVPDNTTSPTNQNVNGWGFKVADYFTPYDVGTLDTDDFDFGSGPPIMVPSSIPGIPEVLLVAGKVGKVFVLNPNNLGKYNTTNDNVLNSVPNGSGNNTPPVLLTPGGSYSTPAYFNGIIYWVAGNHGTEYALTLNSNATFTIDSTATESDLGYVPGSTFISSNGISDAIDWQIDSNANVFRAFSPTNLSNELWDSGQAPDNGLDSTVKFAMPTIADGQVFVGTQDSLTVYGLVQTSKITAANAAFITGYSYDPTDPSTPNSIQIAIGGGPGVAQTILADLPSPELTARLGTTSNDFSYSMPVLSVGAHTVWVYSITAGNVKTLIATETITSQNSLFDENYYLETYPNVAAAVADGEFATGYDHYIKYGQYEGYRPSPYWDENYYLQENPDVAASVKAGATSSGFMNYYLYGQYENRPGLLYFNTSYYLAHNHDVAAAVKAGTVSSAFEHFVLYGQYEGRAPMLYFSSAVYDADNQDILPYVTGETFTSDFEQFVEYGQYEDRIASDFYNEQIYLADNADVAAAVSAGEFPDGFQHWLEYGQYEGRTAV